jgi:hypothetical protein
MSEIVDGRPMIARYGEHFCLTRQDPYRSCGPATETGRPGYEWFCPSANTPGNYCWSLTQGKKVRYTLFQNC